jgi:hypothetical protein
MMRLATSLALGWIAAAFIWDGLGASRFEAYFTVGICSVCWFGLFAAIDRVGGEA